MTLPTSSTVEQALDTPSHPIRLGILGAARIVPNAIIEPARHLPEARVLAIAARDPVRARRFAMTHRIPRIHDSYEDLIADSDVDAIYVALPNALHRDWTIRAFSAGKHVLCEKPLAANTHEAHQMVAAAQQNHVVLMEAFHYAFHPLAHRIRTLLQHGDIGRIRHIQVSVCIPLLRPHDIRLQFELAGGATMDVGCYALHMARYFSDQELSVVRARAMRWSGQIDRAMRADMVLEDGATCHMECSLLSHRFLDVRVLIVGENGRLQATNPILPHLYNRLSVTTPQRSWHERVSGQTTYFYQLRAFIAKIRSQTIAVDGTATHIGGPADALANMAAIDAVYDAAGLARRGAMIA